MSVLSIRILFFGVAAYDGILGLLFLFMPLRLFEWYAVTPPNHVGYVQFPALLLLLFAVLFVQVGMEPVRNRNLIPYGIGLKLAYCAIVFRYWFGAGIPDMWKPFAVIDAVTAILFAWMYVSLDAGRSGARNEG